MAHVELLIGLLLAIALLAGVALASGIPYPVVLVLGGLAIGFIPGVPVPQLKPDVVFLFFLPPLLYSAAFMSSTRELAANAGPISLLAVGLVLATMAAVAVVAHLVVGIAWAPAFVLGAVLGPTDPVSATAVIRRLGAPERIVTILEGESLINDGTGLVTYKIALATVGTASFSLLSSAGQFVLVATGGAAIGVAVGWLSSLVRRYLDEPNIEITIALLTPFAAYIPAERVGVSGVLAAVAAGLWVGRQAMGLTSPGTRLQSYAFWDVLVFLLNSLLFLLVGLQFPSVLDQLRSASALGLIGEAALIVGVVMAIRMAWMFTVPDVVHVLDPRTSGLRAPRNWRAQTVLGWSGMRGAVSLAAALSIPLQISGHPFPARDVILYLTYTTILGTLVLPALTLGPLARRLGVAQDESRRLKDAEARIAIAHAALASLEDLARDEELPEEVLERMRSVYETRIRRLDERLGHDGGGPGGAHEAEPRHFARLRRTVIAAERRQLAELNAEGGLPPDVVREIERDLDLEESRLGG